MVNINARLCEVLKSSWLIFDKRVACYFSHGALFKRTVCCSLSLPRSKKLIQSACVIPVKFLVSAREWPRWKWDILEASQYHESRQSLQFPWSSLSGKVYLPGIVVTEWYPRIKDAFVLHQIDDVMHMAHSSNVLSCRKIMSAQFFLSTISKSG